MKQLTVLSFGGGQDSTTILYKLIFDTEFRTQYAPGDLWVLMADTKNEHPETYEHIKFVKGLCKRNKIFFRLIDPSYYTSESWKDGLVAKYEKNNTIGSKCFPKSCTDGLKIQPIYNFIDEELFKKQEIMSCLLTKMSPKKLIDFKQRILNISSARTISSVLKKRALKQYVSLYGRIDVLIGIAKGEESRAATNEESSLVWMRDYINKVYPLIEHEMDRQDCQDYITSLDLEIPLPSNCILCPFISEQELLYMYRFHPYWYYKFCQLEANKIEANQHMNSENMGVWGKTLLPQKLVDAIRKYGHMTDKELFEYKMSHGHCVKSKY